MIHQQRVGHFSHTIIERAVGKWHVFMDQGTLKLILFLIVYLPVAKTKNI